MPGRSKLERPVKVTVALTQEHADRLQRIADMMGQPLSVAAGVSLSLAMRQLETLFALVIPGDVGKEASEKLAQGAVLDMARAGLPMTGIPEGIE